MAIAIATQKTAASPETKRQPKPCARSIPSGGGISYYAAHRDCPALFYLLSVMGW